MTIRKAIILAAGKGERMRPYTNTCPKPLLPIGGKPLIEWTIARLKKVGVEEIIVNTSYLGDKIKKHFASAASLYFSEEKEPLETGGGILNCLSFFEGEPFWVINGDSLWKDQNNETLQGLLKRWDAQKMDILMSVINKPKAWGYSGSGDYLFSPAPFLKRNITKREVPWVNAGIHIFHPRIFRGALPKVFSNVHLYDAAEAQRRCYGLEHPGFWYHFSTPADYDALSRQFLEDQINY